MDDLIQEFLVETTESLNALDNDIVKLEQHPDDKNLISRIFRLVHTVKGTCGFLGLPRLEKIAHHSENVLGRYRDGSLAATPASVSVILKSFDRIKLIVGEIASTGMEPVGDDSELITKLDMIYEGKDIDGAAAPAPTAAQAPAAPAPAAPAPAVQEAVPPPAVQQAQVPAVQEQITSGPAAETSATTASVEDKTLRVNVDVLENLMTMVSELVLTRNQLLQILRSQNDSSFKAPLQRLNLVVSELQEGVMQTRMQPVGNAWGKLPRIVRDISVDLGKKINLEMHGQETELDRQVLELIKDPLTHMVRNSADHGIEVPKDRTAAGKPEEGIIRLNAYHEGGHIIIEIADDGRGLNMDRIKKKILEKNLATEEQLKAMSEQQIQQFIFAAGFSTAEKVTSVSGRGVGMDVVRTNIEKIGGTIEMKSVYGKGTTFTIKIPLTLAIVSALIVEAGLERYAIPQISVQELVLLGGDNKLEEIHGAPVMRLRNHLLPLIALRKILRMDGGTTIAEQGQQVIVVQVGNFNFGIIVDRIYDTEEIVVKPVAPILKGIKIFSGNTILGDGSVIMILDPNGLANTVGATGESQSAKTAAHGEEDSAARSGDKTSLLIFKAGEGASRAVPLSLVSRLEEIDVSKIEFTGNQRVVQYRGKLMPLIPFAPDMKMKPAGTQAVLVFADGERSMGLMVDEIVDIFEETVNVQIRSENNFGTLGSAIIHGQAMDVIDVGHYISVAHSDWFGVKGGGNVQSKTKKRLLLIDDSPFFLNMLAPMLSVAGYDVVSVPNAQNALVLCQSGEKFDVIISDIEMPGMSGLEFAQKVRSDGSGWKQTPMVALSSHATAHDLDRGKAAGFNDYIAKFDREALLRSIAQIG